MTAWHTAVNASDGYYHCRRPRRSTIMGWCDTSFIYLLFIISHKSMSLLGRVKVLAISLSAYCLVFTPLTPFGKYKKKKFNKFVDVKSLNPIQQSVSCNNNIINFINHIILWKLKHFGNNFRNYPIDLDAKYINIYTCKCYYVYLDI